MPEKGYCADGVMIRRLGEKQGWGKPEDFWNGIKQATGRKLSESTIKRALRNEPLKADHLKLFADAFDVPEWVVRIPRTPSGRRYAWEDILAGARQVAREIGFKPPPLDAVLTFPGASSLFASLVLASRGNPRRFLRIPVYMVSFKRLDEPGPFEGFSDASTKRFKILVPSALFTGRHKRVIVIDDVILSGVTMETLRGQLLGPYFQEGNLKFACCICAQNVAAYREKPEIIGLKEAGIAKDSDFLLPWGKPYANEDAF